MEMTIQEKAKGVVEFFHNIFTKPEGCPIAKILEVLILILRMIIEEMNEDLMKEISD